MSTNRGGSLYWMAPELLLPERFGFKFVRTPATDVYAFGCVCFELYTERPPFSGLPEPAAWMKVLDGERAERPLGPPVMSDTLWQNVTEFWAQEPTMRPSAQFVVQNMVWPNPEPPSPLLPDTHSTLSAPFTPTGNSPATPPAASELLSSVVVSTAENMIIPLDEPFRPFFDFTGVGIDDEILPVWPDAKPKQALLMNSEDKLSTGLAEAGPLVDQWPGNGMLDILHSASHGQRHTTLDCAIAYDQTSLSIDVSGQSSGFLFEAMPLCRPDDLGNRQADDGEYQYLFRAWAFGPALQRTTTLNLTYAIPKVLRLSDSTFELKWIDEKNSPRTLEFYTTCAEQYDQWSFALEALVPSVYISQSSPNSGRSSLESADDRGGILSEDEDAGGRRRSHARSWSLGARKIPRSESASLLLRDGCASAQDSLLGPNLLPRFFGLEVSPLAINNSFPRGHSRTNEVVGGLSSEILPTPPESEPYVEVNQMKLLDLTGQIRKQGSYPQVHGGFADVWKGIWDRQPDRRVAITVLRLRLDDPQMEHAR
ncbi:hypothetical protein B0H12DRAFT_1162680 [Mycena haematopus]|nr:hypothetical protein B0H12DRAFT_1162680 [Mycena haematopus]